MAKFAVVQTGGKQYLVQPNQEIVVEKVEANAEKTVDLPVLAVFDTEANTVELGAPTLTSVVKATVVEDIRGEKVRVAKFKSKVRYRRVTGFRSQLTKLKIGEI
jgi:large subunit ribosomal protein L21